MEKKEALGMDALMGKVKPFTQGDMYEGARVYDEL
jgi:hypothetical protein